MCDLMIGDLDDEILEAVLETIPVEFSVLDANDEVLAWNKHKTRIFKRPESVVGRNVKKCHPEKSLDKVEKIISEMKKGKRDKARFWIDRELPDYNEKQKVMIEYYALRDNNGKYLGCLEASQNITELQKLTGQKRLLD
jgi:PAS domain S-box-containing protein